MGTITCSPVLPDVLTSARSPMPSSKASSSNAIVRAFENAGALNAGSRPFGSLPESMKGSMSNSM